MVAPSAGAVALICSPDSTGYLLVRAVLTLLVGKRLGGAQWVLAVVELEEVVVEVMRAGSRKASL